MSNSFLTRPGPYHNRAVLFATLAGGLALGAAPAANAAGDAAAGEQKAATCVACHGPDGNSPSPLFPRLAGQWPDYIVKALEDYQSGERTNPVMTGLAAPLSAQDRADLAAWFASQEAKIYTVE